VRLAHVGAAAALLALGCAHQSENAPPAPARVRIQNLSDFHWRVALAPENGAVAGDWEIPPRGERLVSVPSGIYRLRQTPADAAPTASTTDEAATGEPVRLAPGRAYTWPLSTLLSAPEEPLP
jgi:hypothetical protein